MVTVSFDPSHLPVNMFDLVYEKWSLRRLLWDVWCRRSEHAVVQALWLWGLHHYFAPHPIISSSDNFRESAKHHLPQNPEFPIGVRLAVRYSGFLEKRTLDKKILLHSTDFLFYFGFPHSSLYWPPALLCQYFLPCETFCCPSSCIHYSSRSPPPIIPDDHFAVLQCMKK